MSGSDVLRFYAGQHRGKPMRVDLHLVSWNRPKMTELVIRTIHRNTHRSNFRLVVLDNGSNKETVGMLTRLDNEGLIDELLLISTNLGLEAARNLMFKNATESDYFICVDNDCLPPPILVEETGTYDWIDRLVGLMERNPEFAAISCRTQVMIGTGNIFEEADEVGDDIVEFPHPGGSLRIMKSALVHFVGGWERESPGRGAEERYICGKLNDAGFRTAFAVKILCLHLFGLRGENPTDRWGYDISLSPAETGHSDISHPALTNGDDLEEVKKYAGEELSRDYAED